MENNELKKVHIKNGTFYYFDDIIKSEDFNLGNILIDDIFWFMTFHVKL